SANNQAFRVQIFTSKLYNDARQALRVAEEIFDRQLYIDYEVPYFKVRVGSFDTRDAAEAYQLKAKAAGYGNAWVVLVTVGVVEAAPLYDDLPEPVFPEPVPFDSTAGEYDPD
ncbi:MAG: SPOR domain-containing protein, partial [candidate division Zixibacteria bacterium]|nr:SPOR domain-containing protein [candidate division Zixibacteria bacterium]